MTVAIAIVLCIVVPLGLLATSWELGYRAGRRAGVWRGTMSDYPATPRQIRRAQKRQRADLRAALRRDRR